MQGLRHLRPALEALAQHRLRSALTVLGIALGIASTALMLALGRGVQQGLTREFDPVRLTSLTVTGRPPPGAPRAGHENYALRWNDYRALAAPGAVPGAQVILPLAKAMVTVRRPGRPEVLAEALGIPAPYGPASGRPLAYGTFPHADDDRGLRRVAVLGAALARELYDEPQAHPLGLRLTVNGQRFRVIGVLAPRGTPADRQILLPFRTLQKRLYGMVATSGQPLVDEILIRVARVEDLDAARTAAAAALRAARGIGPLDPDDFQVAWPAAERDALQRTTTAMSAFLASIAAISLGVGGVGVTNIMLVSLGERTREIGLRYAVGACARDIAGLFLWESALLCTLGGLLGLALCAYGILLARALSDIAAVLAWDIVGLVLALSLLVGLAAGLYPAWRARHLTPTDALRSL